jgi:hypothetical protein
MGRDEPRHDGVRPKDASRSPHLSLQSATVDVAAARPPRRDFNRRLSRRLAIPISLWYIRSIHAAPPRAANTLNNRIPRQTRPPTPNGNRNPGIVNVTTPPRIVAVFAIPLAISLPFLAAILPLLPPRTPNVTLAILANRLEFGSRGEGAPDTRPKSGKNGNVK